MTAKTIFIGIHCFIDSYVHLQTINKTVNTNTLPVSYTHLTLPTTERV